MTTVMKKSAILLLALLVMLCCFCLPGVQAHADDLTALASEVAALQVTAAALDADEGEGVTSHQLNAQIDPASLAAPHTVGSLCRGVRTASKQ